MRDRESIVFSASICNVTDLNASFARGKMRIAHHGRNRNGSNISKAAFEASMHTIFNRPIVAHYLRETDSIGGHDVAFESTADGLFMYNVTEPVGVVPESANVWWELVEEDNGESHEYLCCDIIIWKRQQAYTHLLDNKVTDQSMEIEVLARHYDDDGFLHIDRFEFTAFCLLERDMPCFPSADIELFALEKCKDEFVNMMDDFRREFSLVITASADDIDNQLFSKGGDREMNIEEMMTQYGLSAEDVTFDLAGMDQTEIELRFAQIRDAKQVDVPIQEPVTEPEPAQQEPAPIEEPAQFSLTNEQIMTQIYETLNSVKMDDPWFGGQMVRYWYVDYDMEAGEIYAYDGMDEHLYGYPFVMQGDLVVIDFAAGKRKKIMFADFDDGATSQLLFDLIANMRTECKQKYDAVNATCQELQQFKTDTLKAQLHAEQQRVFAQFEDLAGNERFEELVAGCGDMSAEDLEEKCFAIRGRASTQKFSANPVGDPVRIPVEPVSTIPANEPYGGIFAEYGIGQ